MITQHNRFMALFPGPSGWAGARRRSNLLAPAQPGGPRRRNLLLDFYGAREDNGDGHTDHPINMRF